MRDVKYPFPFAILVSARFFQLKFFLEKQHSWNLVVLESKFVGISIEFCKYSVKPSSLFKLACLRIYEIFYILWSIFELYNMECN